MHNILLIHNDNVPSLKSFPHRIHFDLHSSNVDEYITNEILPEIEDKQFDYICIKDTLSSSYLELYGLRLAYHIRLSMSLDKKRFTPIIILSDLDSFLLNKLSPSSNILFTKNVFVAKNNAEAISSVTTNKILPMEEREYKNEFLNRISIDAPKDYLAHHNITNEWAIYQWSNLLDVPSEAVIKNTEKIASMLYFKYLIAKYHLKRKSTNKIKQTKKSGNVLLIDDKWNEGWKDIIDSFVQKQYDDVKLDVLEYNYKDKSVDDIKIILQKQIEVTYPDTILLDLRLLESDDTLKVNKKKSINKLSGIQLISEIKRINPGIQIIMFTASGDSLILDELHNKGILGYVKKDAPTDKYESSKNSFKKLDTLIKKGIDRNYLKTIWNIQQETLLLPFLTNNADSIVFELRQNVESVFNILNSNIPNPFVYAMLSIFKCIELINDYYIEENYENKKKYAYWKGTNNKIKTLDFDSLRETQSGEYNLSAENKIRAIVDKNNSVSNQGVLDNIKKIACSRNYAIHPQEKDRCEGFTVKEPKSEHIVEWFEMLYEIIISLKKG